MKLFLLSTLFISTIGYAEIYQWSEKNGAIHYSDSKPAPGTSNVKTLTTISTTPVVIPSFNNNATRIISWEVSRDTDSYINLAVKYHYDGKYNDSKTWLSAYTLDNDSRSMNYSVRPAKMEKGTGIVNIRLGVNSRAPIRHCTNKIGLTMYGKDIPTFHKATINFSKCWTNNYTKPTESKPTEGIN